MIQIKFLAEIEFVKAQTEIKNATKQNVEKKYILKRSKSFESMTKLESLNSRQTIGQIYMKIGTVSPSKQKIDHEMFPLTQIYGLRSLQIKAKKKILKAHKKIVMYY